MFRCVEWKYGKDSTSLKEASNGFRDGLLWFMWISRVIALSNRTAAAADWYLTSCLTSSPKSPPPYIVDADRDDAGEPCDTLICCTIPNDRSRTRIQTRRQIADARYTAFLANARLRLRVWIQTFVHVTYNCVTGKADGKNCARRSYVIECVQLRPTNRTSSIRCTSVVVLVGGWSLPHNGQQSTRCITDCVWSISAIERSTIKRATW